MSTLVFGDSIAQGQWAAEAGWVQRLYVDDVSAMAAKPDVLKHITYNLGVGGDTTKAVIKRMPSEVEARRWEGEEVVFVFAVGVNDTAVWEGEHVSSPGQYVQDLEELYAAAKKYSDKIMFVGLAPVEDDNPRCNHAYSNARIWEFEEVLRKFTAENSVAFVPLFETMQKHMKVENLMVDGLHPNDIGHKLMYEQIKPALQKLLGDTS